MNPDAYSAMKALAAGVFNPPPGDEPLTLKEYEAALRAAYPRYCSLRRQQIALRTKPEATQ